MSTIKQFSQRAIAIEQVIQSASTVNNTRCKDCILWRQFNLICRQMPSATRSTERSKCQNAL